MKIHNCGPSLSRNNYNTIYSSGNIDKEVTKIFYGSDDQGVCCETILWYCQKLYP